MKPTAFRHLWGYPLSATASCEAIAARGYAGIEAGLPGIDDPEAFSRALKRHGLELIAQVYTAGFTKGHSVDEHLRSLEEEVRRVLPLGPVLINAHSGEDTWSPDEMRRYFRGAAEIQRTLTVPLAHETHRGRCLFHPTVARMLLEENPELKLVADLSHWVCVCERLIDDQADVLALVAERTLHVHARVGCDQGPQVSDPRCGQFAAQHAAFEGWWQMIYAAMERRGLAHFSFCGEYGPPPYLPVMPFSGTPLADLEEICDWQAQRVRQLVRQWEAEDKHNQTAGRASPAESPDKGTP